MIQKPGSITAGVVIIIKFLLREKKKNIRNRLKGCRGMKIDERGETSRVKEGKSKGWECRCRKGKRLRSERQIEDR